MNRKKQAKGHGEKLSRKQEQAISALLTERTQEEAARVAGIAYTTLWRWQKDPDFVAAYEEAKRRLLQGAVLKLQRACARAIDTLEENLAAESQSVQVRAACAILEQTFRGVDFLDFAKRLDAIEAALVAGRGNRWNAPA